MTRNMHPDDRDLAKDRYVAAFTGVSRKTGPYPVGPARKWTTRTILIEDPESPRPHKFEIRNPPVPVVPNQRKRKERVALALMFPHIPTRKGRLKALARTVRSIKKEKAA